MKLLDELDKRYIDNALDEKTRHRKIEKCKKDRIQVGFALPIMFILIIICTFWGTESGAISMMVVWLAAFLAYNMKSIELRHLLILDRLMEKESSTMK